MKKGTAVADSDELTDAELEKFERLLERKEAKRIAAEREKAGLTTKAALRRNESSAPFDFTSGCNFGNDMLPKEIRCDGSDPACRQRRGGRPLTAERGPLAAPGELAWVPAGHRNGILLNPALPEVDPASVADEPTLQDRLLLGELRSLEQGAEAPANLAARTLADVEAQRRILDERILQQQEELDRRRSHVQAAKAKTDEFLGSRSAAWKEALLGGAPEEALAAAKRAADAEERRRPEIHTLEDMRRIETPSRSAAYKIGANGQPEAIPVRNS